MEFVKNLTSGFFWRKTILGMAMMKPEVFVVELANK